MTMEGIYAAARLEAVEDGQCEDAGASLFSQATLLPYLAAYTATLAPVDCCLLRLLHWFESPAMPLTFMGCAFGHYVHRALVFNAGDGKRTLDLAASLAALQASGTAMFVRSLADGTALSRHVLPTTLLHFPVACPATASFAPPSTPAWQPSSLSPAFPHLWAAHEATWCMARMCALFQYAPLPPHVARAVADPRFLLRALVWLLRHNPHKAMARDGARRMCALSLRSTPLRALAYAAMARLSKTLFTASDFKERVQVRTLLQPLQFAVGKPLQCLPCITTHFCAAVLPILLQPHHPLYVRVNKFLLARPALDPADVPMLYTLLNSAAPDTWRHDRLWLLHVLRCAYNRHFDDKVCRRRHVVDLLCTMYGASATDTKMRRAVLLVLLKACSDPKTSASLVEGRAFLPWLMAVLCAPGAGGELCSLAASIFDTILARLRMRKGLAPEQVAACLPQLVSKIEATEAGDERDALVRLCDLVVARVDDEKPQALITPLLPLPSLRALIDLAPGCSDQVQRCILSIVLRCCPLLGTSTCAVTLDENQEHVLVWALGCLEDTLVPPAAPHLDLFSRLLHLLAQACVSGSAGPSPLSSSLPLATALQRVASGAAMHGAARELDLVALAINQMLVSSLMGNPKFPCGKPVQKAVAAVIAECPPPSKFTRGCKLVDIAHTLPADARWRSMVLGMAVSMLLLRDAPLEAAVVQLAASSGTPRAV